MKHQNFQQKNGMLSIIKIVKNVVMAMITIQALNLKQRLSNHFFVYSNAYILLKCDIMVVGGDADTGFVFKNYSIHKIYNSHKRQTH